MRRDRSSIFWKHRNRAPSEPGGSKPSHCSLAEVRLTQGVQNLEPFLMSGFIDELTSAATLEAKAKGITLTALPVEDGVAIEADRQVLAAVVRNLLQRGMTHKRSIVSLERTLFPRSV